MTQHNFKSLKQPHFDNIPQAEICTLQQQKRHYISSMSAKIKNEEKKFFDVVLEIFQ